MRTDARLKLVGMTLLRFGDDEVKLVSSVSAATTGRVQALLRRTYARTGLNIRQANMLYRVYRGRVTGAEQGNNDRVALAELVNAGLVVHDDARRGNRPHLSDDVTLPFPRRPE